jgi:fructokinase
MILCNGEALIDMLPRQSTAGEDAFAPYPGGAVFNTAIALGRLGIETQFFSGLSTDLFGARLRTALTDSSVRPDLAHVSDRPTTLAFVTLTNGQTQYAFYDENTAGRILTEADLPALPATIQALFFGGISLVVDPCGQAYEALALREAAQKVIMIDPNIRPGFITDEPRYRTRLDRMLAVADIVKLSDEDLEWLEGAGNLPDLAARILARGPKVLCLTEGAKGVTVYTRQGHHFHAATPVTVADTVGAGDTFNAGFLAGLVDQALLSKTALAEARPDTFAPALDLGTRAAAITVSRAGANPPWRRELA